MPKASNLQKGHIINIDNQPYQVKQIDVHTPSARGANTLYKVRYASLISGQKLDQTYKGNDMLDEMVVDKRRVSFLYQAQELYTFMDSENYEQYTLSAETLEDQIQWLVDGLEGITALLRDGHPLCIELPQTIDLEIAETTPVIKGATATNRNKPATLVNGVTVLVPEYMTAGEVIRVNTETGQYMSRVKG
ncbi:elongation factor P-like protein YeiP [Desulfosarcina ovata]|uniref:Elongation factor P-like protein n=2 Tax=Desulfosarcina ovata TaxID=83564 RepID=A0A5K8ACG0_9BACT|nr:elongation factor P-like protein YeiP [Desulfosarcina ovata]BBO83716.1 elongation factor P-like protein [Desulfosarcina ovata subsp. sediminis]BBO90158.1 elongation factor P-like protein [Desulfosarcina ovata subsp. ovata]